MDHTQELGSAECRNQVRFQIALCNKPAFVKTAAFANGVGQAWSSAVGAFGEVQSRESVVGTAHVAD